jgi:hypothetical protein
MTSAASDPPNEPPATAEAPRPPAYDADPDEDQEADVWWGSYAGRAMLPSFLVCGLLTVAFALGAWYIANAFPTLPYPPRYLAYVLAALVWLVQVLRWGYRTVTINYRLTTRRLFRDQGFRKPSRAVELSRVKAVAVEQARPLERLLGIGRLRIDAEDTHTLVLQGVHEPQTVAALVRGAAARARARRAALGARGADPPTRQTGTAHDSS